MKYKLVKIGGILASVVVPATVAFGEPPASDLNGVTTALTGLVADMKTEAITVIGAGIVLFGILKGLGYLKRAFSKVA